MGETDSWRERRTRRKERIRKVLFGNAPRPSRLERALLVFTIVATAFICYYFRLLRANEFKAAGFIGLFLYFVLRRLWWNHKMGPGEKP